MMKYTIKDIAKKAGVSTATVSRVLNKQGNVAQKIKDDILRIVRETGFVANLSAKGLRSQRTRTIGVIVADLFNSYDVEILKGIEAVAAGAGYRIIICDCDNVRNQRRDVREKEYLNMMYEGSVDGVILVHTHLKHEDVKELVDRNYKLSILGVDFSDLGVPSIIVDKVAGSYAGVKHLCGHGRKRIACINGREQISPNDWRINGYYRALAEAGMEVREDYIVNGLFTMEGGAEAFIRLMSLSFPPDAVYCGNDEMAIGALASARKLGLRVPGDIAIIGYDDIRLCEYTAPTLTSMRQPKTEIGTLLCERMIQLVEQTDPAVKFDTVCFSPEIIIRESCGCGNG